MRKLAICCVLVLYVPVYAGSIADCKKWNSCTAQNNQPGSDSCSVSFSYTQCSNGLPFQSSGLRCDARNDNVHDCNCSCSSTGQGYSVSWVNANGALVTNLYTCSKCAQPSATTQQSCDDAGWYWNFSSSACY